MRVGVPADGGVHHATKVGATSRAGTLPRRKHWAGMPVPKKRLKRTAGPEVDDLWAWAVIGVIVGCVTLVLWLPLLKQVFG
jgi:hypothetical protein